MDYTLEREPSNVSQCCYMGSDILRQTRHACKRMIEKPAFLVRVKFI